MSTNLERRLKALTYHVPSPATQQTMAMVRNAMMQTARMLDGALPEAGDGARYTALAFTALEEVSMWAMKALSHGDPEGKQSSP